MAIQQADKLLKKHKDLHCAKVGDKERFSLNLLLLFSVEPLLPLARVDMDLTKHIEMVTDSLM